MAGRSPNAYRAIPNAMKGTKTRYSRDKGILQTIMTKNTPRINSRLLRIVTLANPRKVCSVSVSEVSRDRISPVRALS